MPKMGFCIVDLPAQFPCFSTTFVLYIWDYNTAQNTLVVIMFICSNGLGQSYYPAFSCHCNFNHIRFL